MFLVDTADIPTLERTLLHPAIGGFTTNPTLIARAHGVDSMPLATYLHRVDTLVDLAMGFGDPGRRTLPRTVTHVMVQVAGPPEAWAGQVVRLAERTAGWRERGSRLTIKLPPTTEGLGLAALARRLVLGSLVTGVFNPAQAAACREAGADGAIVYLRRLQDQDPDWRGTVAGIRHAVADRGGILLMASIPTHGHLVDALAISPDVTIAPVVVDALMDDPRSAEALAAFQACVSP